MAAKGTFYRVYTWDEKLGTGDYAFYRETGGPKVKAAAIESAKKIAIQQALKQGIDGEEPIELPQNRYCRVFLVKGCKIGAVLVIGR